MTRSRQRPGPCAVSKTEPGTPVRLAPLLCLALLMTGIAAPVRAELSEKTRAEISAAFPRFALPPAKPLPAKGTNAPAPLSDDPLEVLPDYHVRGLRLPDKDSELWLNQRVLKNKALFEYYQSMSNLDFALNWWHIPLPFGYSLTPSAQSRANTVHAEKKMLKQYKELSSLVDAVAALDSAEAKKLLRALDLDRHP